MAKVALIRCETYDYDAVKKAIDKGISILGRLEKFTNGVLESESIGKFLNTLYS